MKPSPYAGIIRIRLKGSALAISAIMGTPDFYAVFIWVLYYKRVNMSILFLKNQIRLCFKKSNPPADCSAGGI